MPLPSQPSKSLIARSQVLGFPSMGSPALSTLARKLATHVAAHLAEFSVAAPPTNVVPLVFNNGQVNLKVLPDSVQEAKDFESLGMMTTQFVPGVSILEEDEKGKVYCNWYRSWQVHLKERIGNSADIGGGGGCGSGLIGIGQFEIWPLCRGKGVVCGCWPACRGRSVNLYGPPNAEQFVSANAGSPVWCCAFALGPAWLHSALANLAWRIT